jgi:hypothetical protein
LGHSKKYQKHMILRLRATRYIHSMTAWCTCSVWVHLLGAGRHAGRHAGRVRGRANGWLYVLSIVLYCWSIVLSIVLYCWSIVLSIVALGGAGRLMGGQWVVSI